VVLIYGDDMNEIKEGNQLFEDIKHINEYDSEFWYARELAKLLEYKDFRNFIKVINKAKEACLNSGNKIEEHIVEVTEEIVHGNNAVKKYPSFALSRYACYLIMQNADPRKKIVALGQTYFAMQTRKQELLDEFNKLSEEKKRLAIRNDLKEHNKKLVDAAKEAGVETSIEYATFQNYGYMGLYGGLTAKDIHTRKGLKKSHKILDYMGSTELAANLFRATQTEEKLKRDNIKNKTEANETHYEVGKKVRDTIEDLGGTMPENLETPSKSVKKIENEQKKLKKDSKKD